MWIVLREAGFVAINYGLNVLVLTPGGNPNNGRPETESALFIIELPESHAHARVYFSSSLLHQLSVFPGGVNKKNVTTFSWELNSSHSLSSTLVSFSLSQTQTILLDHCGKEVIIPCRPEVEEGKKGSL